MPSFVWTTALRLAAVSSLQQLVHAVEPTVSSRAVEQPVDDSHHGLVSVPLPSCIAAPADSPEQLVLDVYIGPGSDLTTTDIALDGYALPLDCRDGSCPDSGLGFPLSTVKDHAYPVRVSFAGLQEDFSFSPEHGLQLIQHLFVTLSPLSLSSLDPACSSGVSTIAITSIVRDAGFRQLTVMPSSNLIDFDEGINEQWLPDDEPANTALLAPSQDDPQYDLAGELESLRLLEQQAGALQTQINEKKRVISDNIRQRGDKLCLKHLVKECDGVVCAAQAILQRICDKVGLSSTDSSSPGFTQIESSHIEHMLSLNAPQKKVRVHGQSNTQQHNYQKHFTLPTITEEAAPQDDQSSSSSSSAFMELARKNYRNPFVKIFSIIAAALGLTALVTILRKRCMSMRKRVDYAADREERLNARAYRRAARRALMRKRWESFVETFNCFGRRPRSMGPLRTGDYDEKRALILQDAFLEQELDLAEKGEVMEAEIRELRHAHDIVASLVHVGDSRYELPASGPGVRAINDPPPPLVPLPSTPFSFRSRASSGTLPSYFSESLPDYSSRPDDMEFNSNEVVPGYPSSSSASEDEIPLRSRSTTNSSSNSNSEAGIFSSGAEDSGDRRRGSDGTAPTELSASSETSAPLRFTTTRATPTSSILDVSPRLSEETLRTRQSRETRRS